MPKDKLRLSDIKQKETPKPRGLTVHVHICLMGFLCRFRIALLSAAYTEKVTASLELPARFSVD